MAKNTHSQERATGTSDSYDKRELQDPWTQLRNRPVLGEVDMPTVQIHETQDREPEVVTLDEGHTLTGGAPSVGNNSQESSENESTESESGTQSPLPDVPDAESPSAESEGESSTAHSTDGSTQGTQQAPSARAPRKAAKATKSTPARRPPAASDDDF